MRVTILSSPSSLQSAINASQDRFDVQGAPASGSLLEGIWKNYIRLLISTVSKRPCPELSFPWVVTRRGWKLPAPERRVTKQLSDIKSVLRLSQFPLRVQQLNKKLD